MSDEKKILVFINDHLVPAVCRSLQSYFEAYCQGDDIGIETKSDATPASLADRETERILRDMIRVEYPDHGIVGEEFSDENPDAEIIWVLDPLDGTKEFLAKNPQHFGSLIAVLKNGKPWIGYIIEPLKKTVLCGVMQIQIDNAQTEIKNLEDAILSCTAPNGMFDNDAQRQFVFSLMEKCKVFKTHQNCIAFLEAAEGDVDLTIESHLALHDVAALIPVLSEHGLYSYEFDGTSYSEIIFDVKDKTKKYNIVTSQYKNLITFMLQNLQQREDA